MTTALDPSLYVRLPRLSVEAGLDLARALLPLVPSRPSPGIELTAKALAVALAALEAAVGAHGKPGPHPTGRDTDVRLDHAWRSIHARLSTWTIFPPDDPNRRCAEALLERLFSTGLDFLELHYLAEHAQSEQRLRLIDAEGPTSELDRLVGHPFVEELFDAHAAYGVALGITEPTVTSEPKALLGEPLRMLTEAIVAHAVQLLAFAGLSPDHLEPARRALEPIAALHATARRHE